MCCFSMKSAAPSRIASTAARTSVSSPTMITGGVVLSHDYSILPGVRKAFSEFTEGRQEQVIELPTTQCMLIKTT